MILRSVDWCLVTDVSEQPIGPSFNSFLNCLTLENGTDRMSQNVSNYQSTMLNIKEERDLIKWRRNPKITENQLI